MDVCKCIVQLRHEDTLISRRAARPLVWLVEGEKKWEAPGHSQVQLRHEDTLISRRAARPLVWLVEGEKKWEASDHSHGIFPPICG
ncbi:hypothetical protein TNCV_4130411 [Trichonephila clavipes]|nr:hypothetical protein TNCV_4130411 [Trichonephila clavipes]